jgi:ribonuclease Z
MGRQRPLPIVGPPGAREMTDHILAAWREDIEVRTEGLEHGAPGGHRVVVSETKGGVVYDSAGVRITAFPVPHGNWEWSLGYRIAAPGRSIVISGDTRPSEALAEAARGVDVLLHEVYPEARLAPEPRPGGEEWVAYMRSFHTSDRELGALAARVKPGLLVLHHAVRMGATDEELIAGVRAGGFGGRVVVGKDLERY